MKYYHGSPNPNLKELAANSYITPYIYLAVVFGSYHISTGKTWSDSDLITPYDFINGPYFKKDRVPKGIPTIYKIVANDEDINFLDNPFEHLILIDIKVEKLNLCNL